jgi:LDH2 family malate/lactate/ureidoglycolate dehydrogenase
MDMATAAFAWFGVLEAKAAGKPVPEGVAQDSEVSLMLRHLLSYSASQCLLKSSPYSPQGRPTTLPDEVLNGGAIKVFDKSYKGSNLALMVELLAGPLVGAAVREA